MAIYDKPVREIFKDFVQDIELSKGSIIERKKVIGWFEEKYPKIKKATINAHLLKMSTNAPSRIHYNLRLDGSDDLFFQVDSSHFRLYDKEADPAPIYEAIGTGGEEEIDIEENEEALEGKEFAYERDLKNYLAKNLSIIEPDLRLFKDEDITGIEYPVGGRFIDILAVDKKGSLVVIELKVSKGYDRVIGQLLRYMGWIEKNLAEADQKVRGIIIASTITEDLILASSKVADVELFEYQLSMTLKKIK